LPLSATLQSIPAFNPIPAASSILQDIWESILRAVPKQRKSYSRTRSRQMAGKAIKDITSVVKCSSCGRPKRAHILCPYCVFGTIHYAVSSIYADVLQK
jgi:ribosomal protein L32